MTHVPMGRSVRFTPGYDKRASSPNYGIHGMGIAFYYRDAKGAVQFKLNTGWVPWEPRPEPDLMFGPRYEQQQSMSVARLFPYAVDFGYHAREPRYDEQESRECDVIGGQCYYDGSGLNADPVMVVLIYDGEEAMWKMIEQYYDEVFK